MLSADQRRATLDAYRAAGIALIASSGGETSESDAALNHNHDARFDRHGLIKAGRPVQGKIDPVEAAKGFAQFVKDYELDGADVNFEDLDAMNNGLAEDWILG